MIRYIILLILSVFLLAACHSSEKSSEARNPGVVSSATPEASAAGYDILKKGGNAVDAAVAISFVLGVTEPAMSGLGGGTQILLALPGQKPIAINGATLSPAATPEDATRADLTYHRRSTIPSTVKVLDYIWKKHGSGNIDWADLLAPAIRYAEQGFEVGQFRHKVYKKYEQVLKRSPHHTQQFLLPDGSIPAPGDRIYQAVLAQTLRRLAKEGADDFYQGQIARDMAEDMAANDGWVTFEDLKSFPDPVELDPVHTNFRGYDVYSQPPPCGGWTVMLALNMLEEYSSQELQFGTQSRFEKVLTALHLAHQDRKEAPITDLINFQEFVEQKTAKLYARQLLENYQPPGKAELFEEKEGETTHFSVVDKNGMAIAVTASINAYFGAAAASPKLGFLYNTYMNDFEIGHPEHPYAIKPGKMNYSSMSPTIVQKNGKTRLIIGSPGSARIISSVAQLTQLWIDSGMGIHDIVSAPRLHSVNGKIYVEKTDIRSEWLKSFREQGFEIAFPTYDLVTNGLNPYYGGIHAIAWEKGQWVGVADPRRDGISLGAATDQDFH